MSDTCTLIGNVKSVEYYIKTHYSSDHHEWQKELMEYNEQGYLVFWDRSSKWSGMHYNAYYRLYNDEGTKCLREYYIQDLDTASYYDFVYTNDGKLEKAILTNWGKHWSTFHYVYNEKGLMIDEYCVIQKDMDTNHHYFDYNELGLVTFASDIRKRTKELKYWSYNENGLLVEEKVLDTSWASATYHEKDEDGNWIEVKKVDHSSNPNTEDSFIKEYFYNQKNLVTKILFKDADGKLLSETTYTYNEQDFPITKKHIWLEDNTERNYKYNYKFDNEGNWTKIITTLNGEEYEVEERIIKYF